jgi:hypothetical protein
VAVIFASLEPVSRQFHRLAPFVCAISFRLKEVRRGPARRDVRLSRDTMAS